MTAFLLYTTVHTRNIELRTNVHQKVSPGGVELIYDSMAEIHHGPQNTHLDCSTTSLSTIRFESKLDSQRIKKNDFYF